MTQNLETRKFYYTNDSYSSEKIEEGLNLSEINNALLRKLPLIAVSTIIMTSLAFFKIINTPPRYVAGFELLSEPLNIETKVTSTDEESRETREQIASVELDEVQLKILKSPKLISRVTESLKDKYPELNYQNLISGLSIEIISGDQNEQDILQVQYKHPNKYKVSDILDALIQTYLDYSLEKRQAGVQRGITFLDQQIPKISSEIDNLDKQITELRTEYNFLDPNVSLQQITARLNDGLGKEREQNNIKLEELKLMSRNLERELEIHPADAVTTLQLATPQYLELLNQLQQIEVAIGRKSAIFTSNSTEIQTLEQERQEIFNLILNTREGIRQKLENQIETLENRQQSVAAEKANLESQIEDWLAIFGEYNNLRQRLTLANQKLNEFTIKRDALLIDAAQREAPWQLLTPPSEPKANNISAINYLVLSSTLGILIGVGIALLLDKYQRVIYTTADVEKNVNLPVLATIPYGSNYKGLFFTPLLKYLNPAGDERHRLAEGLQLVNSKALLPELASPSIEKFRSVAAHLGIFDFFGNSDISDSETNLKSLIVTSSVAREGKSTVAFNLAKAAASMGKRVLLVDANFRSSDGLTKSLGLESEIGLMNFLNQDKIQTISHFARRLPLETNLYFLNSGVNKVVANSSDLDYSRLLTSPKMLVLMEELKANFDLVIYDLCSIIEFADVNLLSAKTDGIIVVTGLGKIQNSKLTEALNQLRLCKAPILGVVANKVAN